MVKFWKQLDRRTIYSSDWLTVTLDKLELPGGRVIDNFELMHYSHNSVGIVAVNDDGKILLVKAYRYFHETFDWEIPGGVVERNENHVCAARRELLEETGHEAGIFSPMLRYWPHKATCDEEYFLFLAQDLKQDTIEFQKFEVSEIGFFTRDEIMKMIDDGEINDGMSLVALQKYFLLQAR